ncbi:MAG: helix-turn-helix transcriptional regulator [Oscillospiraceae bacterium]|nr:helix-turn-helix transcriptional regulator [Oscillospiraceae bacterium]
MAISYNRMWKLLVDKKMSKADLRKAASVAPNTMTKLRRDEPVNLVILERICGVLACDSGDIMHYIDEPAAKTGEGGEADGI